LVTQSGAIIINTLDIQTISAEELNQEVCMLPVKDAYFGPIVNIICQEADFPDCWKLGSSEFE